MKLDTPLRTADNLPSLRELLAKCDFARLHPERVQEVVEKSLLPAEKNNDRAR